MAGTQGVEWKGLTVELLKQELRARGLPVSGRKAELVERLEASDAAAEAAAEPVDESSKASIAPDPVAATAPSTEDVGGLTVAELGELLVERGLSRVGKKAMLVERLREALAEERGEVTGKESEEPVDPDAELVVGDHVEALWEQGGEWHSAVVTGLGRNGDVRVRRKEDEEERVVGRERVLRTAKLCLARLQVGQRFRGRVRRIIPAGAFVGIGADRDGLVRKCRMAEYHVMSVQDEVRQGQEVDVWVYRIPASGKLGLSMIEYKPSKVRDPIEYFSAVSREEWLQGRVRFSCPDSYYVDVEALDGSCVAQGYLSKRCSKLPAVGSTIKVRVTNVREDSGTLSLSENPPPKRKTSLPEK